MSLYIQKIDQFEPDPDTVKKAARVLSDGGLIISPTETNYGFLGRIDDERVVRKIFTLKKRDLNLPTAIFIGSIGEIDQFGDLNPGAARLADKFLPGPLTLVLNNRTAYGQPIVTSGKIGIRISSSPLIEAILEQIDFNLTATSANVSGSKTPDAIDILTDVFGAGVDLYLDSGRLNSLPSTVVDCTGDMVKILRSGAISEEKIRNCIGKN